MNLAVCFFGKVGGKKGKDEIGGKNNPSESIKEILRYAKVTTDNVDVFIHSWSEDDKDNLIKICKPKLYKFQEQIRFNKKYSDYPLSEACFIGDSAEESFDAMVSDLVFRSKSRWYSQAKSLELMQIYSNENNKRYDMVLQVRLDLIFITSPFPISYSKDKLYLAYRKNTREKRIEDLYFMSGQEIALKFQDINNSYDKYHIDPPCALLQFIENNKINCIEQLEMGKGFYLPRWEPSKKRIFFILFLKKIRMYYIAIVVRNFFSSIWTSK